MRITIVQGPYFPVPALLNSGAEKVWFGLGAEFARQGHAVTHLSRRYPGLRNQEAIEGVQHVRLPSRDAPKSSGLYRLYDAIYSWRAFVAAPLYADIIVTNCTWLPIFLRNRRRGAVYVHIARYPKGQMWLYRHADRLQAVSRPVAEAIILEQPAVKERVVVIPPYLSNVAANFDESIVSRREKTILYIGRIHEEKGIHLLLEAFKSLNALGWNLKIVGSADPKRGGSGDEYLRRLKALSGPAVEFVGSVDQNHLNDCYRHAGLLVYPSLAEKGESFGMVPLEAMACGCPVLVSNLACFREYLLPNQNGFVFDHRDQFPVRSLSVVLKEILDNHILREKVAAEGNRTAREFRLTKVANRYLEDFLQLSRGNG